MTDIKSAEISIALLAGGKSSRMGKDKALLTYDGKTFLERLIEEFSAFEEILVSVRDENQYELEKYGKKVKVIADENFEKGPLEGIRRSLSESKNDFVFISAADMPFMTKDLPFTATKTSSLYFSLSLNSLILTSSSGSFAVLVSVFDVAMLNLLR